MDKEEKQRRDLKAIIDGKMESYGVTKKSIYSIIGILGCLLLVVVLSITGADFNPSVFLTWNYWVLIAIQYGITIYSMIAGEKIGEDTQRNKPNSQYRLELKKYKTQYDRIDAAKIYSHFEDWLIVYREKKLNKKELDILKDWHITQPEVLDLDINELNNLSDNWKKDWSGTEFEEKYKENGESVTYFKPLTRDQIEVVKAILSGEVTVSYVESSYFMNALKGTSTDEWERASHSGDKRKHKLASGYIFKLLTMFFINIALTGIVPSPYGSSGEAIAWNIAQRVFTMVSAVTYGVFLGMQMIQMDVVFLAFKTYIIKLYADEVESGEYKIISEKEQAKMEYEKRQEEKRKEAENVITPIIVPLLEKNAQSDIITSERENQDGRRE